MTTGGRAGGGLGGPAALARRRGAADALARFATSRWLGVAAVLGAAALPFVTATPYALSVMTSAAIFVMLSAGLNVVVGYCGLLDLGYAAKNAA